MNIQSVFSRAKMRFKLSLLFLNFSYFYFVQVLDHNFCTCFPVLQNYYIEKPEESNGNGNAPGASALLPFLKRFGYLESGNLSNGHESETLYTKESIEEAVREMQMFGGLPQTGELDKPTLELLKKPRCGLPDVIRDHEHGNRTRRKRYVIGANGWNKRRITYRIENWAPELDESSVSSDVRKAFNAWADYARLRFVDKPRWNYDDVDISISFGRGHHGDRYPFDGAGGVLAHAFFPYGHGALGGDIHFDLDEKWKSASGAGGGNEVDDKVSFYAVVLHEIGHSLGLAHSPSQDSVMFPYYQYYEPGAEQKIRLGYDDIMAMYQLYIQRYLEDYPEEESPSTERATTERILSTTAKPHMPTEASSPSTSPPTTAVTTITTRRDTYLPTTEIFTTHTTSTTSRYTNYYPSWSESTIDRYSSSYPTEPSSTSTGNDESGYSSTSSSHPTYSSYPVTQRDYPSSTEASVEGNQNVPDLCVDGYDTMAYIRSELFVFKNEYMWRFRQMGMKERGYPVKTARLFPMLKNVNKLDAVFENADGKIYFFSGRNYWTFDETGQGSPHPALITDFSLPSQLYKLDGVFIWGKNEKIYFFSGNVFWRYNGTTNRMDDGYPKGIERWRGLPGSGIDSVFKWSDGRTYFFKGNDFWRFDDTMVRTEEGFPLPTSEFWFGC